MRPAKHIASRGLADRERYALTRLTYPPIDPLAETAIVDLSNDARGGHSASNSGAQVLFRACNHFRYRLQKLRERLGFYSVSFPRAEALSKERITTMQNPIHWLFGRFKGDEKGLVHSDHRDAVQVVVPDAVELPLPKRPYEEISVPASINGRDLSSGRL